jgi:hypothetical protein
MWERTMLISQEREKEGRKEGREGGRMEGSVCE